MSRPSLPSVSNAFAGAVDFARKHPPPVATAMRRTWAQGYGLSALRRDVLAGAVVGIVALPLSMALAIAVGVAPEHGLYTAIVAGVVVALTGGSKLQITGPTASYLVVLTTVFSAHGLRGLFLVGLMAGVLLVVMGWAHLGKWIQFIPHPVTTAFTAGIATMIAVLQLKDAFGLHTEDLPPGFLERVLALWSARGTASLQELAVASATLAILLGTSALTRRVPAPLVAIPAAALGVVVLHALWPSFQVATIGSRFHTVVQGHWVAGIPSLPPAPALPWSPRAPSLQELRNLFPAAFAIAMLGAIESLVSATVADAMTGKRHDPNAELIGLGLGNIVTAFFGGIAASGALARTATNVRAGGRSPIAAVTHSVVVLLSMVLLARLVAYVPMAALAALLLVVAWNMSAAGHFLHMCKVAPKSDVTVLLVCYGLTVVFDMVVAVTVGVVLAALLFMKRMAELTYSRAALDPRGSEADVDLPAGVELYEIAGPLFFGAAQEAMGTLELAGDKAKVLVLDLGLVPTIDATGLVAFESTLEKLRRAKKRVVLAGLRPDPQRILERAGVLERVAVMPTRDEALAHARSLASEPPPSSIPPPAPGTSPWFARVADFFRGPRR